MNSGKRDINDNIPKPSLKTKLGSERKQRKAETTTNKSIFKNSLIWLFFEYFEQPIGSKLPL